MEILYFICTVVCCIGRVEIQIKKKKVGVLSVLAVHRPFYISICIVRYFVLQFLF